VSNVTKQRAVSLQELLLLIFVCRRRWEMCYNGDVDFGIAAVVISCRSCRTPGRPGLPRSFGPRFVLIWHDKLPITQRSKLELHVFTQYSID